MNNENKNGYMNPYIAGVLLGLTLLLSFLILGGGLGASAGIARIGACLEGCVLPEHTVKSEYFGEWGKNPLLYYLVFMFLGIFLGGLFSASSAKRLTFKLEKGNSCPSILRIILVFTGGIIVGFASRMARGCTSGQALTGGALLLTGSIIFMLCVFMGGYAMAYFVRRQWHD